jgi:phosphoribosylformimino-5-aminoimidazole carboxamide ribotide isomerase
MLVREFATIPAIDVLDGRAVRLLRGDYDRVEVEAGDPLALVRRATSHAPPFVHVVALGAARDGGTPLELARSVVEAAGSVAVQLGGGVRSPEDARALIEAGVERVVVGTAAFGPTPLREFVSDRIAVAIDVAGGIVRTNGWRESTELTTTRALDRCTEAGVATVICTAIDRDGTRSGPNLCLLREVRARFDGCVLAAGGIRDSADVAAVRELGLDGVIVGRAWLDGTLELAQQQR